MFIFYALSFDISKEDYLKLYESFKDDIAKYTDGFEMGFVRDGKVLHRTRLQYSFYKLYSILLEKL